MAVINQCTYSTAVINQCTYSIAAINKCAYSIAVTLLPLSSHHTLQSASCGYSVYYTHLTLPENVQLVAVMDPPVLTSMAPPLPLYAKRMRNESSSGGSGEERCENG